MQTTVNKKEGSWWANKKKVLVTNFYGSYRSQTSYKVWSNSVILHKMQIEIIMVYPYLQQGRLEDFCSALTKNINKNFQYKPLY